MKIEIKRNVSAALRREINDNYFAAVPECGNEEIGYINGKFERLIGRLERSSNELEKNLAVYSSALHDLIIEEVESGFSEHHRCIVAALFYLCNPYDVIPDFNTQDGYLDDAIVINLCMNELRKKSNNSYLRLTKLIEQR
jgi:uncharacterized membrane protein YkvA (DUF1232 family)